MSGNPRDFMEIAAWGAANFAARIIPQVIRLLPAGSPTQKQ